MVLVEVVAMIAQGDSSRGGESGGGNGDDDTT